MHIVNAVIMSVVRLPALIVALGGVTLPGFAYSQVYQVDDSYTVEERYFRYSKKHPELRYADSRLAEGIHVQFDRRYATANPGSNLHRDLHLDIFQPELQSGKRYPCLILIHGGGWRSGNKSHMFSLANEMVKRGYIVVTPEYRLSVEALYPSGLVDINNAILWVKAHADGLQVDFNKMALVGGSSGGHMAALLGFSAAHALYSEKTNPLYSGFNTQIEAVIDLDGVLDLTTPLAIQHENRKGKNSAAALWLGASYHDDPTLWEAASPTRYIDARSPTLLFIGSGLARFSAGFKVAEAKLKTHGIIVEFMQFDNTIHTFWLFEPWVSRVADCIDGFLDW